MISSVVLGNAGRDAELRYSAQGTAIATFSMASNDRVKKDGVYVDVTTWVRVTAFSGIAETASKRVQKGSRLLVIGRLRNEEYVDRDGKSRQSTEVRAQDIQYLDPKPQSEGFEDVQAGQAKPEAAANGDKSDDDIPF